MWLGERKKNQHVSDESTATGQSSEPISNDPRNALKAKLIETLQARGVRPQHLAAYVTWLDAVGMSALVRGDIRFNSSLDTFQHRSEVEPGRAALTLKKFLESFEGLPRDKLESALGRFEQLVEECQEVESFRFWFLLRDMGGRNPTLDSGYEIHCSDAWHFPTALIEPFLPSTDDADNALKHAYQDNAWTCLRKHFKLKNKN